MNKITFFFWIVLFLLPFTASSGTIERYCFMDMDGSVYDIRGGKLGKKAYLVRHTSVFCSGSTMIGIATFAKLNNGYALTLLISSDPANAFCSSFVVSASVDANLNTISGNIDYLPRNFPPDESFSATQIMCAPLASNDINAGRNE